MAPNASPFLVIMFSMCLFIFASEAKEYIVGGSHLSWKLPLPSSDSLTQWANKHQFRIGDALIFKYDWTRESVHVVNETDYSGCITKGQNHVVFDNGNTRVLLNKSGTQYFISGTKDHCQMGLKLAVVVISDKNKKKPSSQSLSPSPSPSTSSSFPSPSPSPSPSPIPSTNHGVAHGSGGGLKGVMTLVIMFLIWRK